MAYVLDENGTVRQLPSAGSGRLVSATGEPADNAMARFHSPRTLEGVVVQGTDITIDDSGNILMPALATIDGEDISELRREGHVSLVALASAFAF